jgi:flagella basal body P-ring formation protein FlgA
VEGAKGEDVEVDEVAKDSRRLRHLRSQTITTPEGVVPLVMKQNCLKNQSRRYQGKTNKKTLQAKW